MKVTKSPVACEMSKYTRSLLLFSHGLYCTILNQPQLDFLITEETNEFFRNSLSFTRVIDFELIHIISELQKDVDK